MRSTNPIPMRFAAVSLVFLLAITYPALSEETTTSTSELPTVIPPDDNLINDTIRTTAATSPSTTLSTTTTTLPTSSTSTTTKAPTTVTTEVTSTTEKPSDLKVTRGSYNSKCTLDSDCQSQFLCVSGVCHCEDPQIFDLRQKKCVTPLGRSCDPADLSHSCPQFAECFMERCVCKTGYSMHTLTRCKSDIAEVQDYKPLVLWPTSTSSSSNNVDVKVKADIKQEPADDKSSCNSETCDVTKGLTCQNGACKCKDVKEIFLAEFGRCLNKTMQNYLRDALNVIDESGDEIKKLVKLLEKIDQDDQQTEGSHHYSTPVHQLVGLFGEDDDDDGIDRDILYHRHRNSHPHAQYVAPRASRRGDLHFAAQEPVSDSEPALGSGGGASPGDHQSHSSIVAPPSSHSQAPPLLTSGGSGNWQPSSFSLSGGGQGSADTPIRRSLALDNLEPQSQDHEPTIVERQAPHYGNNYHYPSNNYYRDPYHYNDNLGYPDGSNHLRIPIHGGPGGRGLFGLGGLGGLGHLGGLGALGHGLGGLGHGLRGFGHGLGGGGGGGHRGPGGPGGGGGGGGGGPGGHGGGLGHKPGVLSEVGEVVGRLLKLIERFLPLIHAVNEVIRKEQLFKGILKGGLGGAVGGAKAGAGGGGGGPGGPRGRRFGEELSGSSKEELTEEQREGGGGGGGEEGILGGLVRFMGILMRLRERLNIPGGGGGALRKILEAAAGAGGGGEGGGGGS